MSQTLPNGENKQLNIVRLQIAFTAHDFDASVYFYETQLGMTRVTDWDRDDSRGIVLSAGEKAAIEIYGAPRGQTYDGPAPTGIDIVFEVKNVDQWYERLKAAGFRVDEPPENKHWAVAPFLSMTQIAFQLRYFPILRYKTHIPHLKTMLLNN